MTDDRVTLELLGTLLREIQTEQRLARAEQREMRSLVLALADQGRRTERRVEELRDDLELMIKAELMGRLGHFENQIDHRLERLEERVAALEGHGAEAPG